MKQDRMYLRAPLGALSIASAMLAVSACDDAPTGQRDQAATVEGSPEVTSTSISQLPLIDSTTNPELLAELLEKPTNLGETTALQVRLPPPNNPELANSLVRVIGEVDSPHVLFSSDALAQLGVIPRSPGKEFFTAFVTLPPEELDRLVKDQDEIASGVFGKTTDESVVFSGRNVIGRTVTERLDPTAFRAIGTPVALNRCPIRPVSTEQAWGQSLFINAKEVVLDPLRTWDPCTGAGTQGGVWTFAHLIREMANGSGKTPEDFVKDWLSMWLNNYTVNGDVVPARTQMFSQVIQPWATASGVTATLVTNPLTGVKSVSLTGPLNLDIAPYRLEAIVNRIDLGRTTKGGGYGSVTGRPIDAGELRFIFGVVQPNPWGAGTEATCGKKLFTTIFEYGVPKKGCSEVVLWAKRWTSLQQFSGFTGPYLAKLAAMTEEVVIHGAAPSKGNQNAINQIRTNEIALGLGFGLPWELREFTLTDENPATNSDVPSSGGLRKHTVALTPNEAAVTPDGTSPQVNGFVTGPVMAGLDHPVALPGRCNATFSMPFKFGGASFRGGNALVTDFPLPFTAPPGAGFWMASAVPFNANGVCARHQFSLNTCHGCHRHDTATNGTLGNTNFTHIDPLSPIPVKRSFFLTGTGPGMTWDVADTQFGAAVPKWRFADLDRRLQRLFDLSHCTACLQIAPVLPKFVESMQAFAPVPADVDPAEQLDVKVGPVTDLETVKQLLDLREATVAEVREEPADVIRQAEIDVH